MALIVEDGTGKLDAESYADVAFADDYHAKFGNAAWAAKTTGEKEIALRQATAHMVTTLRGSWKGLRTVYNQALDHPRRDMWRDDYDLVDYRTVAPEVKVACCELALVAIAGTPLMPTAQTRTRKSVKVGPIAIVYDGDGPTGTGFIAALSRLAPLLEAGASSGHMVELIRG